MEDARFVRFVDDDGIATYFATYTAYDGTHVGSQLLTTVDFRTFTSTQLTGRGARNKGMALFPRRIGGRYVALSRWDRETNAIVTSDDPTVWDDPVGLQRPAEPWDLIQLGNCGSPIESPAGWIMLTHGVGPMRRYAIGAELLDLDDPTRVIGHLREPLLTPAEDERDGYVPNVVYSCGAMLHGDTIVLPYGMSDANVGIATIPLRAAPRPVDLTRGRVGSSSVKDGRSRTTRTDLRRARPPPACRTPHSPRTTRWESPVGGESPPSGARTPADQAPPEARCSTGSHSDEPVASEKRTARCAWPARRTPHSRGWQPPPVIGPPLCSGRRATPPSSPSRTSTTGSSTAAVRTSTP